MKYTLRKKKDKDHKIKKIYEIKKYTYDLARGLIKILFFDKIHYQWCKFDILFHLSFSSARMSFETLNLKMRFMTHIFLITSMVGNISLRK